MLSRVPSLPAGAWFPIAVAGGVFLISYLWKWGTSRRLAHSAAHGVQLDDVLQELETPDGPVRRHRSVLHSCRDAQYVICTFLGSSNTREVLCLVLLLDKQAFLVFTARIRPLQMTSRLSFYSTACQFPTPWTTWRVCR